MPKYLLDTNACVTIRNSFRAVKSKDAARQAALERLIAKWRGMPASDLAMSFITLGELGVWAEKHADPPLAQGLMRKLAQAVQVLGVPGDAGAGNAQAVAQRYAQIRATLERAGANIGANDSWIAAHAIELGLTVVTGDGHFSRVDGLAVEDWAV